MVSNVKFEYINLKNIKFDETNIKTGGIILIIGNKKINKMNIINKLKKEHEIKTIFTNIDFAYLQNKRINNNLNREYIITNYEDVVNKKNILHSIENYRILLFILMEECIKLPLELRIKIDYILCDYNDLPKSLSYLYENFIYMFKNSYDFYKFVLSQIKKDDWIVIHNTNRKALKPEEYIYLYNELY